MITIGPGDKLEHLVKLTINPAQLITVGKRAAQWAQDLVLDLENIEIARNGLKLRGKEARLKSHSSASLVC